MSTVADGLTAKERARFLEAARLGGLWYLHNQNAPGQRWGGVDQSADTGRFLYEYFPATGTCRGAGVWSQGLATCALMALSKAIGSEGRGFRKAADLGAGYLMSLQWLDGRNEKALGAFREHTPQTTWSFPRDGATGAFCLAVLNRETGVREYLDRADLFCRWYHGPGSEADGWPYCEFHFDTGEATQEVRGDWQAGGALCYFYAARASGDNRWIEEGFRPVCEVLLGLGDPTTVDGTAEGWHGESRITVGNDDFATVAAIAAFLAFDDERYLDLVRTRVTWLMSLQDADGSFPNSGGTFVTALTLLDFVDLVELKGLDDKTDQAVESLLAAARFGLSLQETGTGDRRAYGGLYGQSNYGVSRDRIHNRSTSYSIHLNLRLAGRAAPCLSAVAWAD